MGYRKKIFIISFCSLFLLLSFPKSAIGKELSAGFTVEGLPNDNQIDKNLGYFYLKEEPGTTDKIDILLSNTSSVDKTLKIKVVDANTNMNGLVDYTGSLKNHANLETPLSSLVSESKLEVFVPKNSEIKTSLNVEMPAKSFAGVVLGGVLVTEDLEKEKVQDSLTFKNTYSYTIAIALTNTDTSEIKKQISLELEKVKPILFDGRKIVQADILNPNSYIFNDATVTGSIYKKSSKKKIIESKKENVSIAPHSVYPFMFDWKKKDLEPGIYVFHGKVVGDTKSWEFKKEFKITSKQSNAINKKSVFKVMIPKWLKISEIIILISAICSTSAALIRKLRKKGIR